MNHPASRIVLIGGLLLAIASIPAAGQVVKQGDAASEKTVFQSPMVLEVAFAAADRSLWDAAAGHAPGEWFSTEEYHNLGRFSCDGVYLRDKFSEKRGSWKPGLELSVKEEPGGDLKVKVRAIADNPDDNKDRKVEIRFEVMNGDKVIASDSDKSGVEEGNTGSIGVTLTLHAADLIKEPMTKLRLTMTAVRD